MALSTETIEVLYIRNGLGKFHLPAAPLQYEYDHCIHDFARAIESEVREQDEALIRQLVGALEGYRRNHNDTQPCDAERAGRAWLEAKK